MKKIKNIFICASVALCAMVTTSCNDVLDVSPSSSFSEDMVWGSNATIDAFVNQTYSNTLGLYLGPAANESWTPNGVVSNLTNNHGNNNVNRDLIDRSYDTGFNRFGLIRRINMIIERSAASEGLSEGQKALFVAEGHFLRGLVFMHQATRMGRFVPIRKVLNTTDTVEFHTPLTASIEESFNLVIEDLEAAVNGLPETSQSGRANKYVALGYISRACLTAYAYTNKTAFLDKAIAAADQVINSGKYSLDANYANMFNENNGSSKEIMLGFYRKSDNTTIGSYPELIESLPNVSPDNLFRTSSGPAFINKAGRTFECWGIYFPTQNLVDQYLATDAATGKALPWNETSQFKDAVVDDKASFAEGYLTKPDPTATWQWGPVPSKNDLGSTSKGEKLREAGYLANPIPGQDISDLMYGNRDKRFYATIVYDKSTFYGEYVTMACHGNLWAGCRFANGDGQEDSWYTTATGYYWRKYLYQNIDKVNYGQNTDVHFTLMRLGEVYLNKAEALLYKGQVADAVQVMNETRTKHGGIAGSEAASADAAWVDYMRERRVEMAYENDYYWSLLRWGKQGKNTVGGVSGGIIEVMNSPVHKIQINKERTRYFVGQAITNNNWDRNFSERRYLFPIPQGHINTRTAFGIIDQQNPNW